MNISIIIATYNYGDYIGRAITSVLEQSYQTGLVEILLIDDGSTDNTAAVIAELQHSFPCIQYFFQPNTGKAAATEKGIALATGDVIFILDADDWFLPAKISTTLKVFQQYPNVVHVASPAQIVWEDGSRTSLAEPVPAALLGKELNGIQLLQNFYQRNILFGGGSTFAARAAVLKQMPLPPAIDMYTDEWLLLWTLQKGNSYFVPEPLSVWHIHENNYSGKGGEAMQTKQQRMKRSSLAVLDAMQQHHFPTWLQQLYSLKHSVREMHWKEVEQTKTLADNIRFLKEVILKGRHSLSALWHHHAFNRLWK